jgi:hypothetical protein
MQAASSLTPSRFEVAMSHTITGVNRRVTYKDGTGMMYGDLHRADFLAMESRDGGPMQLVYVRREIDNRLTGIIATVPCTAQADEMGHYVTADYWSAAREYVKNELGDDITILGLIRAAGDLSPHTMVDGGKLIIRLYGENGAVTMGLRIGKAIVQSINDIIASYDSNTEYGHMCANVSLPLWTAAKDEYESAIKYKSKHKEGSLGSLSDMMEYSSAVARIKRYELGASEYDANFYAVRIGDVMFITNPFEMYIEYADRIRMACPEAQIFDVQLSGDDCLGYLATQKAIDAGGYSAMIFSCFCDAKAGDIVVEKSIALIKSLYGEVLE